MTSNPSSPNPDPEEGLSTPVGGRRTFFTWVTTAIAGFMGFALGIPLIGYFISPAMKRHEKTWASVGKIDDLPVGEPRSLDYRVTEIDGWMVSKAVKAIWALRQPDNKVIVYSPICPHLGCGFRWSGPDKKFKCPCHGSVYDLSGKVLAGPAPRSLDVLPSKVENGELQVMYKEFKSGLAEQEEI